MDKEEEEDAEKKYLRRTMKPMLVPKATGSRMDTAGWAKTCPGRVREGI